MKKFFSIFAAAALTATLCAGCTAAGDGANASNGTLVMATNAEFPPYESIADGEVVGFDVDMMRAVCDKLGYELKIENIDFDSIITSVNSGKADVGVAGMTVTEDRLENVDFSDPYTTSTQVIIVREESNTEEAADGIVVINDVADLDGKTIGVQLGTTGDIYASDIKDATIERYKRGAEAVMALTQGKVDAVIIDNQPAKVFVEKNEGLVILEEEFTIEEYAIAIKKGNTELLEAINGALAELKADGTLDEITAKWIGDSNEESETAE